MSDPKMLGMEHVLQYLKRKFWISILPDVNGFVVCIKNNKDRVYHRAVSRRLYEAFLFLEIQAETSLAQPNPEHVTEEQAWRITDEAEDLPWKDIEAIFEKEIVSEFRFWKKGHRFTFKLKSQSRSLDEDTPRLTWLRKGTVASESIKELMLAVSATQRKEI